MSKKCIFWVDHLSIVQENYRAATVTTAVQDASQQVESIKVLGAEDGMCRFVVDEATEIQLYAINGNLVKSFYANQGEHELSLMKGIYIIKTAKSTKKIIVR